MDTLLQPHRQTLAVPVQYGPAVSIFMPFKPTLTSKTALTYSMKLLVKEAEQKLLNDYPGEVVVLVIFKLNELLKKINYSTSRKSIAIYVSPVFEKVLYPDFDMEAAVAVEDSFQLAQLTNYKKQSKNYLLLLLNGRQGKIYLGDDNSLSVIVSAPLKPVYTYVNDAPERVGNFSDISERRQAIMEKFIRHTDNGLGIIIDAYRLPVFVMGPERIIGHFKKMTRHQAAIVEYIAGNYYEASVTELNELMRRHMNNWNKVQQKALLQKIEAAADKGRLVSGVAAICKACGSGNGKLLVMERNYFTYNAYQDELRRVSKLQHYIRFSYIHDALDAIVEKVIEDGGDIELVDDGMLQDYDGIALVKYF
ncbi:MAG: baeRF3 domain-containing protein [Agriterribacter sp.]